MMVPYTDVTVWFYKALLALVYLKIFATPLFTQMTELIYLGENIVQIFFVKFSLPVIIKLYINKNVCCASFFEWSVKMSSVCVS